MTRAIARTVVFLSWLACSDALAELPCGDVNESRTVTSSDALEILRSAVGQPVDLVCGPPGGLGMTGQTTCYDADSVEISCSNTGQDGESKRGVAHSFTSSLYTIRDNVTGLVWQRHSDNNFNFHDYDNLYAWSDHSAIDNLNATSYGGFDDWRMPSVTELESILDYSGARPRIFPPFHSNCTPNCTLLNCACTSNDRYWTSTTSPTQKSLTWAIGFGSAQIDDESKATLRRIRAVRGGL